jgi:hypothetical protein
MKPVTEFTLGPYALQIIEAEYASGRKAFFAQTAEGEPFGAISVNLPELPLDENEFFAKTWGENEVLRAPLLATGAFIDTGKRVPTGHVIAEVWSQVLPQ